MLDLKWFLAMKQTLPVSQKEKLANWELIHDDFEVFRELLIRYEYWNPLQIGPIKVRYDGFASGLVP